MGTWEPDAAIGPEVDLEDFEWEVDVTDAEAPAGSQSLRIWNEGDYDGVTWVTHPVPVSSEQEYLITVTAQFWSESESFNTLRDAVMRLGSERPETEEEFPHPGVNTSTLGNGAAPRERHADHQLLVEEGSVAPCGVEVKPVTGCQYITIF